MTEPKAAKMTEPIYPVPQPVTFDGGRMVFEQIVTEQMFTDSMIDPFRLHEQHAKRVAEQHGYRVVPFTDATVTRYPAGEGFWLLRFVGPVRRG